MSTPTVDTDGDDRADTYKPGDTVRARGDVRHGGGRWWAARVLKLKFDPNFGEKDMTFDAAPGRTNVTALDFTYTVVAGNHLHAGHRVLREQAECVGAGASIRRAGTQENAGLAFAKVDHDAAHKVDGAAPALIATDPVEVTSSAESDSTYAIGDAIDITATFAEAVNVTTAGDQVAGPRIAFTLGTATKQAVYHSGGGGTALVFRYEVAAGDADTDGISVDENGLALNGGAIADLAGNAATAEQLEHSAVAAGTSHKVDGMRPRALSATVDGTVLRVTFSEALGAAASLSKDDFTVKKTSGGTEVEVDLSGTPSVSGNTLTLTLASAVATTDTDVKVSYTKPATDTGNRLVDTVGNEAASFADVAVTRIARVSAVALVSTPTVDTNGDGTPDTYKPATRCVRG